MTKTILKRSGETKFGKIRQGVMFYNGGHIGVFIKTDGNNAVALHKEAGHMNAGQTVEFKDDTSVQIVTSVQFNIGIHTDEFGSPRS